MRRLLILFALCASCFSQDVIFPKTSILRGTTFLAPAAPIYAVLHSTTCSITSANTSFACTIPSTTAGSLLVMSAASAFGATLSSCTDSASGSYTDVNYSNSNYGGICYRVNVGAGVTSVTMTVGASNTAVVNVLEISGGVTALDKSSTSGTITSSPFSIGPTATLSNSSEIALGFLVSTNGILTLSMTGQFASGTQQSSGTCCSSGNNIAVASLVVSTNAAVTFAGTVGNNPNVGLLVTFH